MEMGKVFFQFLPTVQELRKHLCLVGPLNVYSRVTGQMLRKQAFLVSPSVVLHRTTGQMLRWLACQLCRIEL